MWHSNSYIPAAVAQQQLNPLDVAQHQLNALAAVQQQMIPAGVSQQQLHPAAVAQQQVNPAPVGQPVAQPAFDPSQQTVTMTLKELQDFVMQQGRRVHYAPTGTNPYQQPKRDQ